VIRGNRTRTCVLTALGVTICVVCGDSRTSEACDPTMPRPFVINRHGGSSPVPLESAQIVRVLGDVRWGTGNGPCGEFGDIVVKPILKPGISLADVGFLVRALTKNDNDGYRLPDGPVQVDELGEISIPWVQRRAAFDGAFSVVPILRDGTQGDERILFLSAGGDSHGYFGSARWRIGLAIGLCLVAVAGGVGVGRYLTRRRRQGRSLQKE
jgi:hypothetical protein